MNDTDTIDETEVLHSHSCFSCGGPPTRHEYDHTGHRYGFLWLCSDECNDMLMEAVAKDYGWLAPASDD